MFYSWYLRYVETSKTPQGDSKICLISWFILINVIIRIRRYFPLYTQRREGRGEELLKLVIFEGGFSPEKLQKMRKNECWNLMLTSVNGFAFRSEILYLCTTEMELALRIGVISTFFIPKIPFLGSKNKLPCFFKVKQPVFYVTYCCVANTY